MTNGSHTLYMGGPTCSTSSPALAAPPPAVPALGAVLARAGGENFPVALRVLPGPLRADLMALYGYARLVDELGDAAPGDRPALLDWAEAELDRALAGTAGHPVFRRVGATVRARRLPAQPLRDLIEANRRDQRVTSYADIDELWGYCALSADPVGRLVLALFDAADQRNVELSDRICSALQLVEHLQDVVEDARAGRVYLPADDMARFGVDRGQLTATPTPSPLRALLAFETWRARRMLHEGAPLVGRLTGWGRLTVAGFVAGGLAAADALAAADFDVSGGAPGPAPARVAGRLAGLLARGRDRR